MQDPDRETADRIAGMRAAHIKQEAADLVRELGFAFSINAVLHRANLDRIGDIIELAGSLGADRLELANTQYYGWAFENRRALIPTRDQVESPHAVSHEAKPRYRGRLPNTFAPPHHLQ